MRAPADPEASQVRLKVPRELPPLPDSGGRADVRERLWDSHEEGPPTPGDWRLLGRGQVQDVAADGSNNPA